MKYKSISRVFLFFLTFLLFSGAAFYSSNAEEQKTPPPPSTVKVGLFITQLNDLDMVKRTFDVTFWGWFLTTDETYKPSETIEIVNAKSANIKFPSVQQKKDFPWDDGKADVFWNQAKYFATISSNWDLSHYPFDRQELKIPLEDAVNDQSMLKLTPDAKNSGIDQNIFIPGWTVKGFSIKNEKSEYATNYGDVTAEESSYYSRLVASITVERDGFHILFSSFAGFFLSFLLVTITYGMGTSKSGGSRVGVVAAAIFAAIGNKNSIDSSLPATPYFTVADAIQSASFIAIVIAMAMAVSIIWLEEKRPNLLKALNVVVGIGSVAGYVWFIWRMIEAARA